MTAYYLLSRQPVGLQVAERVTIPCLADVTPRLVDERDRLSGTAGCSNYLGEMGNSVPKLRALARQSRLMASRLQSPDAELRAHSLADLYDQQANELERLAA